MKEDSAIDKRAHNVRFHSYELSRIGKSIETESSLVVARDRGRVMGWGEGVRAKGCRVYFWGDENVLKSIVVMVVQLNRLKITGLYALRG